MTTQRTVFRDESVLFPEYIPHTIPHRMDQIRTLEFYFQSVVEKSPQASQNVLLYGPNGAGKTMLAKNLLYQAVLAGHSARFVTASDLILDLTGQETGRALNRRLRASARPSLLCIDEIGYLTYDAHAADLLFQVVSRRYEQKSIVVTTNLAFKAWDTIFPNASCAVALIDRLTHHAEILTIDGESYRKREAELAQTARRSST